MAVTKWNSTCKLQIVDTKIKVVQFKYMIIFLTEDRKFDNEIGRRIGIVKDDFQMLSNILGNSIIS